MVWTILRKSWFRPCRGEVLFRALIKTGKYILSWPFAK
jgi:hypothetical protein